jgi:hypothetical protein
MAAPALATGALLLAGASATHLAAQQETDARWLPWLGCWESEGAQEGSLLCILPMSTDVGVEMVAVEGGEEVSREWVRADAEMREGSREGCSGWERARFSEDARRIYLDADHLCEGDVQQETSGLLALVSDSEWIDVRAVRVGEQTMTGVNRYRLAPSDVVEAAGFGGIATDRAMAVRAARVSASARIAVGDVIDASAHVADDVVRAWIAQRQESFRVDADQLLRMADAGVSPEVIDVVVAVSYPRYFSLGDGAEGTEAERRSEEARAPSAVGGYPGMARGRFWDPFYGYGRYGYYDPFYMGYGPGSRYGYGSGYTGYGYGYGGGFRPTVIVVEPRVGSQGGRVVNGRGYTRSRPTPSTSPSPAPSSSGSAGSSGSGSGSSGGSTGRTAKPRPPGN